MLARPIPIRISTKMSASCAQSCVPTVDSLAMSVTEDGATRDRSPGGRGGLRALAPHALRSLSGGEQSAHVSRSGAAHPHHPGGVRGSGCRGRSQERLGAGGPLCGEDAAPDLPARFACLLAVAAPGAPAEAGAAAGGAAGRGLFRLRLSGLGLSVLAGQEEG